jgi:hypothetical protein
LSISGSEVAAELDTFSNKIKSMRDETYYTTKLVSLLSNAGDVHSNE